TLWLKRSTVQNIVIGGAAGTIPPLVGWAAVTGSLDLEAWLLFAIIFFWTPAHFWALALLISDDYKRAGIPMLPVVRGEEATTWGIFTYALSLVPLSLLLFLGGGLGPLYLVVAVGLGLVFVGWAERLIRAAAARLGAVAYARGVRRMKRRRWPVWRTGVFFLGIATLLLALVPAVEAIAADLFSVHMLQHVLLTMIAPPL